MVTRGTLLMYKKGWFDQILYLIFFIKTKMFIVIMKVQEKDKKSFPQDIGSIKVRQTPHYTKLYTEAFPINLKSLNQKQNQSS